MRPRPLENAHNAPWRAVGAKSGAPPLRTLTYDPAHPELFLSLFQASPLGQDAQFGLLGRLIQEDSLGQGDTFDFVCMIVGAAARLGYEVGGASPLMREMALHLDRQLEYLLTRLKDGPGENAFNLVLAGAHGAPPNSHRRELAHAWRWRAKAWPRRWTQALQAHGIGQRDALPVSVPVPGHQRLPGPRTGPPGRRARRAGASRGGRILHRRRALLHHDGWQRTLPQQLPPARVRAT